MNGPVGVGLVGAGDISDTYLTTLSSCPDVEVVRVADLDTDRARAQAEKHRVPRHGTTSELLADPAVEIVVNLTIPAAHFEVGLAALAAGKHVWSEKPLALDVASGRELIEEGRRLGLRTACAPDTILGPGLQTARRAIDAGAIGSPVSATALMQTTGPERWHPNPGFLYDVGGGPLFDLGPYFIAALAQQLGPVIRIQAVAARSRSHRTIARGPRAGESFPVRVPSQHSALLEFASGASATLIVSFEARDERALLEFTGSEATLRAPDPRYFEGASALVSDRTRTIAPSGEASSRGIGVVELARAIRAGAPERACGELGLHVLDVLECIATAADGGASVEPTTTCERPSPLPEDWDPRAATLTAH